MDTGHVKVPGIGLHGQMPTVIGDNLPLSLKPPVPILFGFFTFFIRTLHISIAYQHISMLKIKRDINQQDLKRVDLDFVKSE